MVYFSFRIKKRVSLILHPTEFDRSKFSKDQMLFFIGSNPYRNCICFNLSCNSIEYLEMSLRFKSSYLKSLLYEH